MAALTRVCAGVAALLTVLTLAAPAQAVDVTIGFDDLAAGTTVTSQYAAANGITFGSGFSGTAGNTLKTGPASALAQSPPNVLRLSDCTYSGEFPYCSTEAWLRLDRPQTTMSLRTGLLQTVKASTTVQLTTYTAAQSQIAQYNVTAGQGAKTLVTLDKRAGAFPCSGANPTCNDGLPPIAYVKIAANYESNNEIAIDDVIIDKGAPPAPPEIGLVRNDTGSDRVVLPGGTSRSVTFRLGRTAGSAGAVSFTASGLPSGVTGAFVPTTTSGGDGTIVTLTLGAPVDVKAADATVTVTATPASNAVASGPRTVTVPLHVQSTYDLQGISLMPTQSVVTDPLAPGATAAPGGSVAYSGTPLVAGKRTIVLAHARALGADAPLGGVVMRLVGTKADGTPLPGSPLNAEAAPATVGDEPLGAIYTDPTKAFSFTLPPSWTTSGPISLRTQSTADNDLGILIEDTRPQVQCATCSGNEGVGVTNVSFVATQPVNIVPVEIVWQRPAGTGKVAVGEPGPADQALAAARAALPVSDANYLLAPYAATLDASEIAQLPVKKDADGNNVNADGADVKNEATYDLLFNWEYDQILDDEKFFATGYKLLGDTVTLGIVTTIARGLQSGYNVKRNGQPAVKPLAIVVPKRPLTSVAHEIGHALGRPHADNRRPAYNAKTAPTATGCGGGDNTGKGADQGWPNDTGLLDKGGMAVDIRPGSGGSPGRYRLLPATSTYDFMSYCASTADQNSWVSDRGWRQALRGSGSYPGTAADPNAVAAVRGAPDAGSVRQPAVPRAAATVKPVTDPGRGAAIEVSGFLGPDGQVQFTSVGPAEGPRLPNQPGSTVKGSVTDAAGRTIGTAPLSVVIAHNDPAPGIPGTPAVFVRGTIPTHGKAAAGVAVRRNGKLVGTRKRSRFAPTVKVRTPTFSRNAKTIRLSWTAKDRDTKRLQARVQVSKDGGKRYATLFVGPSRGSLLVAARQLPAGARTRVRVVVSDGFNRVSGRSKLFRAFGAPPTARVTAIRRVLPGARVFASVSAFDDRSEPIAGGSIAWFADGRLVARGAQTSIGGLARGRHVLRTVVVDARGRVTVRRTRVLVSARR